MARSSGAHGVNVGFFGPREAQRFYAHHEAADRGGRPRAVVLCNPGPQEYRQCHWALRQLADRLADAGAHVLRFDYVGTGDSAGDADAGSLDRWADDVHDAVEELRAIAGVSRVTLVGLRLGAAIAWRAAANGTRVHELIGWDPVVRGTRYLAHLDAVQERIRLDQAYPISDVVDPDTLLGVTLTRAQRAELAALDLATAPLPDTPRITLFHAEPDDDIERLAAHGAQADAPIVTTHVPDASLSRPVWHEDTLLAQAIPSAIVAHLVGSAR